MLPRSERWHDKGTPAERPGRKATGPPRFTAEGKPSYRSRRSDPGRHPRGKTDSICAFGLEVGDGEMLFLPLSHRSAVGLTLTAERTLYPPARFEFERTPRDARDGTKRTSWTNAFTPAESVVRIDDRIRVEKYRERQRSRRSPLSRHRRAQPALRCRINVQATSRGTRRGEGGGSPAVSWGRGRAA
jgi:hypothetical protein